MNGESLLRKSDIKVTKARIAILEILENSSISLDVEEILHICQNMNMKADLSTVYRTLELFEVKGIVEKFDLGNGKYSHVLKKEAHKHLLLCKLCHKEVEIDCPMKQIEELIKTRTGFSSIEHELKIEGICEECKSKKK
ncbi:MAG: Fur family transcriptional regulator [Clostridiaceae bacterium]